MGYLHCRLSKDGKQRLFKVHVLVAEAFLDYDASQYDRKDLSSYVVDHLNRDKTDNRVENLQVITQEENLARWARDNKIGIEDATPMVVRKRNRRVIGFKSVKAVTVAIPIELLDVIEKDLDESMMSRSRYFYEAVKAYYEGRQKK